MLFDADKTRAVLSRNSASSVSVIGRRSSKLRVEWRSRRSFASGVSDAGGEVARFGESLVELPVTVAASTIVRQLFGFITGDRGRVTYRVRGFLNTGTFGRVPFDSTGEIDLSKSPSGGG